MQTIVFRTVPSTLNTPRSFTKICPFRIPKSDFEISHIHSAAFCSFGANYRYFLFLLHRARCYGPSWAPHMFPEKCVALITRLHQSATSGVSAKILGLKHFRFCFSKAVSIAIFVKLLLRRSTLMACGSLALRTLRPCHHAESFAPCFITYLSDPGRPILLFNIRARRRFQINLKKM